jgi:hypothetical protein
LSHASEGFDSKVYPLMAVEGPRKQYNKLVVISSTLATIKNIWIKMIYEN